MPREIKFRAWHMANKYMMQVGQLTLGTYGGGILDEHNDFHPTEEIELLQYMNIKDDEGAELYEMDIIEIEDISKTTWPKLPKRRGQLRYFEEQSIFCWPRAEEVQVEPFLGGLAREGVSIKRIGSAYEVEGWG